MNEKIEFLLIDLTHKKINSYLDHEPKITSGKDILKDIIKFENGKLQESPFVQIIELDHSAYSDKNLYLGEEQMSSNLNVKKDNLHIHHLRTYNFFETRLKNQVVPNPERFLIFTDKNMVYKSSNSVFEIRTKINGLYGDSWSPWHAISGKFIIAQNVMYGPNGIVGKYNDLNEERIKIFNQIFQIRYSGESVVQIEMADELPRISSDPCNSKIKKIIDPYTFQILFDSTPLYKLSVEESFKTWQDFEKRYR